MEFIKDTFYILLIITAAALLIFNLFAMKDIEKTKEQFGLMLSPVLIKGIALNTIFVFTVVLIIASIKLLLR